MTELMSQLCWDVCPDALARQGDANAQSHVVVVKGTPELVKMVSSSDINQVEAAVGCCNIHSGSHRTDHVQQRV